MTATTHTNPFKAGDFIAYTMVTDTAAYKVVKATAKTIQIIPCMTTGNVVRTNGEALPVVWREVKPIEDAKPKTLRLTKKGQFKIARWAHPFHPCTMIDGVPVDRTDYKF